MFCAESVTRLKNGSSSISSSDVVCVWRGVYRLIFVVLYWFFEENRMESVCYKAFLGVANVVSIFLWGFVVMIF